MRSGSPIVLQLGEIEEGRTLQRLLYSLLPLYRPIHVRCFFYDEPIICIKRYML